MWPKIIWRWDIETETNSWNQELKLIINYAGLSCDNISTYVIMLEEVECRLKQANTHAWKLEAYTKPKLCTYIEIHDFDKIRILMKANLSRMQHSLVTKFKCGVFPLRIETGHYKEVDREKRYCQVCNTEFIENEMHFLYSCQELKSVRDPFMLTMSDKIDGWNILSKLYRTKLLLSEEFIKLFASWLENMYYYHRSIL